MHVGGLDHFDGLAVQRGGAQAAFEAQAADIAVGVEPEFDDVGSLLAEVDGLLGITEVVEGPLGDLDDAAEILVDKSALGAAHARIAAAIERTDQAAVGTPGFGPAAHPMFLGLGGSFDHASWGRRRRCFFDGFLDLFDRFRVFSRFYGFLFLLFVPGGLDHLHLDDQRTLDGALLAGAILIFRQRLFLRETFGSLGYRSLSGGFFLFDRLFDRHFGDFFRHRLWKRRSGFGLGRNRWFWTFDGRLGSGGRRLGRQGLDLVEIQSDLAAVDRFVLDLALLEEPEQYADDQEMQKE